MKQYIHAFATLLALWAIVLQSSAQVTIDGVFNDWDGAVATSDPAGDHTYFDLLQTRVYSDADFVNFQIHGAQDWQFNSEYGITLCLDLDADPQTGTPYEGMGADLIWRFHQREGTWNGQTIEHGDVGMYAGPTVTSDRFEVAFDRNGPLQFGDSIRFAWVSMGGADDKLPDSGSIVHTLDNNSFPYSPLGLQRLDPAHLRLMTYNVEHDGLVDPVLGPKIVTVIQNVAPDIITFNELWDTPAGQVKQILDTALPIAGGWHTDKLFNGNVTASRYPITQSYLLDPEDRILVSLIGLPASYPTDIVVANLHLKCCDADNRRQEQVDGLVALYRDLQQTGGNIDVPFGTAFVVQGDMNLVGDKRQLETIVSGDVLDEVTFGNDFLPDWDGSPLADSAPLHHTQRQSYTWPGTGSSYYPGRLDYIFFSDYALRAEKALVVSDSSSFAASDHLPVVVDFSWNQVSNRPEVSKPQVDIVPNPAAEAVTVKWEKGQVHRIELRDAQGRSLGQYRISKRQKEIEFDLRKYSVGSYYILVNDRYGYPLIKN